MYIDDIIKKLRESGRGCHINGIFLGCILYAYDVLLISNSFTDLQHMLDICVLEADSIDMRFNVKKYFFMRCGTRYKMKCAELHLAKEIIATVDVIKHPGIMFQSGMELKCTFDHVKAAFYHASNALFAKCSVCKM